MTTYYQLRTQTLACAQVEAADVNTTHDLEGTLATALAASPDAPPAPPGGGYGEVRLSLVNTGAAAAYLAHTAEIAGTPDEMDAEGYDGPAGDETAPTTTQVIPPGMALADGAPLEFGPYRWRVGGLPRLRLLAGASCVVTLIVGVP